METQPKTTEQGYIARRAEIIPTSTYELFEDPQKQGVYEYFKFTYSGEPTGTEMPKIIRSRGGQDICFEDRVFTAMTTTGSHLVHMRRAFGSLHGLPEAQRYFVVTVDAHTSESKEWLVDAIEHNEPYEPDELRYLLHEDTTYKPQTMQFLYKENRAFMSFNGSPAHMFTSTFEIEHDLRILEHASHQTQLTAEQLGRAA